MSSGSHNEKSPFTDWEAWLVEQAPRLLLFARQQARSEEDAQDLVQEAVMECWTRQPDTLPELSRLYATIRHRAIDLARSNDRRTGRESAAAEAVPVAWFDPALEDRERAQMIERSLRSLPDIYREVVTLRVWGELTFAEIGDALGIPPNTAASRYRYALAELRRSTKGVLA